MHEQHFKNSIAGNTQDKTGQTEQFSCRKQYKDDRDGMDLEIVAEYLR